MQSFTSSGRRLVGKGDALAQLAELVARQGGIQLRLAEQHHLQQLGLLGLQVGQQAQRLQGGGRQRLCLVDQQHRAAALGGQLDQADLQGIEHALGIQLVDALDQQFAGQGLAQPTGLMPGLGR